ncbi:hypothetical protein HN924_01850 [Candidatus Woesearchaeota archaeon]|jgi:hypothetical protein|nr:hypothetical protein [Candidatus Woesearchaeota archaeon]MBT7062692.1 hypothetical protein [Candidatus Woesearchaeota archaeon]MBT7402475.1 hypothetical protein [Candidatus Woesearchaeota archaeon]
MENMPIVLFAMTPLGNKPLPRGECNGKNMSIKPAFINLQKRMEQHGWVDHNGNILLDILNITGFIVKPHESENYQFCLVTSNANEKPLQELLTEFKSQYKEHINYF